MLFLIDFVIYFLADKQKQNKYKVRINMIANSPSMIINCGSDFYCKANIIQSIINNKSKSITSNIDERGKKIILSWAGDDRYKPLITAEVNAIHKAIDDWYIQDYKTYKSIVNNQDSNYINGTETYAKVALLTKINTTGEKNFISINNEIVNKKYKPALIMALTLIIAVIFSSSYHIIKRSILEYKNKLNRSFY
ncbi:Uncharacterised protein [Streptococcus pneumoniae]|nr:Uncharacterised protein [Streptococcus pneumoniae]